MHYLVFDIETKNTFFDVGSNDAADLDISVVGVYDSRTATYGAFCEEEFATMWPFFDRAEVLVGFNSDHFDIPLLNKYYSGDLTQKKSIDLLKDVKAALGHRLKLDSLAEATLGEGKSGNGLEAIGWWNKGEVEKVKQYCLDDVRITKELFEYAREHKELKFKDNGVLRSIPLDISHWEEDSQDNTQSLF